MGMLIAEINLNRVLVVCVVSRLFCMSGDLYAGFYWRGED